MSNTVANTASLRAASGTSGCNIWTAKETEMFHSLEERKYEDVITTCVELMRDQQCKPYYDWYKEIIDIAMELQTIKQAA